MANRFTLPEQALVTSRFDPAAPKRVHYALVCYSEKPLDISSKATARIQFRVDSRNLVTESGPSALHRSLQLSNMARMLPRARHNTGSHIERTG